MAEALSVDDQDEPVTTRDALVAYLEAGCKPSSQWRIGTEHEKFGFRQKELTPISYEGKDGIGHILTSMAQCFGWQELQEGGRTIALAKEGAAISLEPGGQVELSGAPLETIHQTQAEINEHLRQLAQVCKPLGLSFLGIGTQPKWHFEQIPWMPKGRYREMRRYLPTRGDRCLDMMTRTATVQANLDFSDEGDMVRKFRLAMALQPVATALFANSPFIDGLPTGFLSYRAEIWRHTDPDRCGWLPFVFAPGFGFERYVEYALDVPMLFVYRHGEYFPAGGVPFRQFLAGKLPALPGQYPLLSDWVTHLSTLFPDVRLKRYLEMRGADAGNSASLSALPALWKGLLYDAEAMGEAWELVESWSLVEREAVHGLVPRLGLATPVPGACGTMQELASHLLEIARSGLKRQNQRNAAGCDESVYLQSLFQAAESGLSPAHHLLTSFQQRWGGRIEPLFHELIVDSFIATCR